MPGRLLRAGVVLVLAGCTSSSLACTDMGCSPGVFVDLHDLLGPGSSGTYEARVCVDGRCETTRLAGGQAFTSPGIELPDAPARVTVSFELRTPDGGLVADATISDTPVRRLAPNGSGVDRSATRCRSATTRGPMRWCPPADLAPRRRTPPGSMVNWCGPPPLGARSERP